MGKRRPLMERVDALEQAGDPEGARQVLAGGLAVGYRPELLERYARLLIQLGSPRDAAPYLFAVGASAEGDAALIADFRESVAELDLLEFTSRLPAGARWLALERYPAQLAEDLIARGYTGPGERPPRRRPRESSFELLLTCGCALFVVFIVGVGLSTVLEWLGVG